MNSYYLFIYLVVILSVAKTCATYNSTGYKSYKNYKLYEVQGNGQEMKKLMDFLQENYEVPYHNYNGGSTDKVEVMVAPEHAPAVEGVAKNFRLSTKTLVDDFSELIEDEKAMETEKAHGYSWKAYHDVDSMYNYMQNLSQRYSDMAQTVVAGRSYEGRPIMGMFISRKPYSYEGARPVMFLESGIHGREWVAPAATMYFMNQLLTTEDSDLHNMRDAFDWYIFPVVNPDGYQYSFTTDRMWRKTRSRSANGCYGADMNRNFDYNWMRHYSSNNPCDYSNYAGSAPFSEVESRALSNFVSGIKNLGAYIAVHGAGQSLRFPYTDTDERVENYDDLREIGETSLRYGYKVDHAKYKGPATGPELGLTGSSSDPCEYQSYAGSRPFSEIETRTLANFVSGLKNKLGYLSFHAYAQNLRYPFGDTYVLLDNYEDLNKIGSTSLQYGYQVNHAKYGGPGPGIEVGAYKVSGSSIDWIRYALGIPIVFCYELRGNSFFWPARKIPEMGEEVTQMMLGLTKAACDLKYYAC